MFVILIIDSMWNSPWQVVGSRNSKILYVDGNNLEFWKLFVPGRRSFVLICLGAHIIYELLQMSTQSHSSLNCNYVGNNHGKLYLKYGRWNKFPQIKSGFCKQNFSEIIDSKGGCHTLIAGWKIRDLTMEFWLCWVSRHSIQGRSSEMWYTWAPSQKSWTSKICAGD